jgi:hypothetical protein
MNGSIRTITLFLLGAVLALPALAAPPPDRINYQGVLRDDADRPLDGDHDMVFRFWSADAGGDEILIDAHDAAHANPVTVTGGLFNVELGGGDVTDGSGPGTYTSLAAVFRDYDTVWLALEVGGETLDPRVRVISAAYALNADYLDGVNSTALLRSNTSDAFTSGTLSMNGATTLDVNGTLRMDGPVTKATTDLVGNLNADLLDGSDSSDFARTSHTHPGSSITSPVDDAVNADLLDGMDSTDFAGSSHNHPGSDITSPVDEAANADTVDGRHASEFLDTSATAQTKVGELTADASAVASSFGVVGLGQAAGGYFEDADNTGYAHVGSGNTGISARGTSAGGFFRDLDESGYAYVGRENHGIWASGTDSGGYFRDEDGSGFAYVATNDRGISGQGNEMGGNFRDRDDSGTANLGYGDIGVYGYGTEAGAFFTDSHASGYSYIGYGDLGIRAEGNEAGGYFNDTNSSGYAYIGFGDYGVNARGDITGGYFEDSNGTGEAYVGYGGYGISASGSSAGGYFADNDHSGHASVGYQDYGIDARGSAAGGYFADSDSSGWARTAWGDYGITGHGSFVGGYFADTDSSGRGYVGYGDYGVYGSGSYAGGHFEDSTSSGYAYVGYANYGISAHGSYVGGHFEDTDSSGYVYLAYGNVGLEARGSVRGGYFMDTTSSGRAYVADGDRGIWAKGTFAGGTFSHPDNTTFWLDVSTSTRKIVGTGTSSFVQNHPYEEDRVIVYAAPEGDEVAVYTRGTARLVGGEARVRLGETFQYVTNPDIGLTAHVTPRSVDAVVYVESVSTTELVVRSVAGFTEDATFDYLVYGLRLGFEELSIVQRKEKDALLPPAEAIESDYLDQPELRSFNAMERFRTMHAEVFPSSVIDLSRSQALVAALERQRPAALARAAALEEPVLDEDPGILAGEEAATARPEPMDMADLDRPTDDIQGIVDTGSDPDETALPTGITMPVSVPVELGDVLVFDLEHPGMLRPVAAMADPNVVGIAAAVSLESAEGGLAAPLADGLYVTVKVDAGYGAILPGDLLVGSPTPGHAMRALEVVPGTILGKALEPLDYGTGSIRVLLILR